MIGIYKITNNLTGSFYIGQSISIKKRFMDHKSPRTLRRKTVLSRAFRKYGIQNFTFEVLELCDEDMLDELEINYIKTLTPRYNMNDGGVGNKGHHPSKEARTKISISAKNQWKNYTILQKSITLGNLTGPPIGHLVSLETREKLRTHNLGKKQSLETIAKRSVSMSVSMLGNKSGNKKVAQVDPITGMVIKVFESARIAAEKNGVHPSGITHVIKGNRITCAGFKWEYAS